MTPARILIVENDRIVARDIQSQLTGIGYTVTGITARGEDALAMALETHPDLVLMDIRLEGALDGIEAAEQIRNRCQIPVVFLTAYADEETLRRATLTEPFGYILKPFEDTQLRTIIEIALFKHASERKLRESERRYAITLSSIGDAVIATDSQARVLFINPAAEALTGWTLLEAIGMPLVEVFHIVNEETRRPVEDPAAKVLRLGVVVGLANHTALIARDGREVLIDDSGAPIIDDHGAISGVVLVFRDITQRRLADEAAALQQQNTRLDLALRGSGVGIWDFAFHEGTIESAHMDAINVWEPLGYDAEEVNSGLASSAAIFHPDDRDRVLRCAADYLSGQSSDFAVECRVLHKDGSYRWRLSRGVVARGPDGMPVRFIGSTADITDRKHSEALLDAQKLILEQIVRGKPLDEVLDSVCRVTERLSRDGMLASVLVTSPGSARFERGMAPSLPRGFIQTIVEDLEISPGSGPNGAAVCGREVVCVTDIGSDPRWSNRFHDTALRHSFRACWSTPIFSNAAEVLGTFAMYYQRPGQPSASDIHIAEIVSKTVAIAIEQSHSEQALRASEARFRGTFENAAVGIVHCDTNGRYVLVNERFCEIIGYTRDELLQMTFGEVVHPDDRVMAISIYLPLMRGESENYSQEVRCLRKDGSLVWIHATVSRQSDSLGTPVHSIGIVRDISESKRLNEDLRQAKEAAEAANRAKDEFLSNVSHEIRTPMNAILGMTQLTLDTVLADDQRQCLQTVKSAADNLLGIINDLLDFSKIEAGKLQLHSSDFSLRLVLGDTLRILAVRAHRKGLELVSHVHPDVPDALIGDAGRLRQVLLNLVGNAIKFTEEGEVVVSVVVDEQHFDRNVRLRFAVRDTGIGILPEKQETIFRAFEQEDASTTRKYSGTGLGLTIAAQLVALMGGRVAVESHPGRGSTFRFTAEFVFQPNPPVPALSRPPVMLKGLRVLVVDDNATNRQILEEWLSEWNMAVQTVGDGVGALNALWDAVSLGQPYELVLLDGRMPDTDGLTLAASIRKRVDLSATRIILLTSGDRPGDFTRFRELKIDANLLKPILQDDLLETIYRVMSNAQDGPPPPARRLPSETLSAAAVPLRVLVAEDNEFGWGVLERMLRRRGHTVVLATDGRQALAMAEEQRFDLLLLDVHLPEVDGFGIAKTIRDRELQTGGHLPIIALTARSRKEDRERCLAAGMEDFLSKPIEALDLWAAIDRVVPAPGAPRTTLGLLDARVLLAACGDKEENLLELCAEFRVHLPAHLADVKEAFSLRDAPKLREAAHKLCQILSAFSTKAGATASDLEDRAAIGQLEEAEPLVDRLLSMAETLTRDVGEVSFLSLRLKVDQASE